MREMNYYEHKLYNYCYMNYDDDYKKSLPIIEDYEKLLKCSSVLRNVYNYQIKLSRGYFTLKYNINKNGVQIRGKRLNNMVDLKNDIKKNPLDLHLSKEKEEEILVDALASTKEKKSEMKSDFSVNRTRQTLYDIVDNNFIPNKHSLFVTLTYDINKVLSSTKYGVEGAFDYDIMLNDVKRFIQRFKRQFGEKMNYCYFVEKQNGKHNNYEHCTGAYHIHMLIFNAIYFKMGKKNMNSNEHLQNLWGHGIPYVEKVPTNCLTSTAKYISKYIQKDTCCVALGSHALHTSRGLIRPNIHFLDFIPFTIQQIIGQETENNLGLPFDINNFYFGYIMGDTSIKSRYLTIFNRVKPIFKNGNFYYESGLNITSVTINVNLDFRKNYFKKQFKASRKSINDAL